MVHLRRKKDGWIEKDWIKETGKDYIAYSEGVYYKVNNAVVFRIPKKQVVLRNTWTGKERVLKTNISKPKALKFMKEFIKKGFKRIW